MADANQLMELKDSKDTIEARIPGKKCTTIAYPCCNTGTNSLVRQYYIAARGCSGQTAFPTPSDFMNISSMICGSQSAINSSASFNSTVDGVVSYNKWCVYLIHGINGTEPGAYSPINADIIRASLEYLKASPDKFWVSSFGNVAKYIRERNCIAFTETSSQDSIITLQAASVKLVFSNCHSKWTTH